MHSSPPVQPKNASIVLWVIWAAMTANTIMLQWRLGGGLPQGQNSPGVLVSAPIVTFAAALAVASVLLRWAVMPRAKTPGKVLAALVFGLAAAHTVADLGIFLVPRRLPQWQLGFFATAMLCLLQSAPLHATRSGAAARENGLDLPT